MERKTNALNNIQEKLVPREEDCSSDCIILDDHDHHMSFNHAEPVSAMYGSDYGNYLRNMLGINRVDGNTVARCVYIPKAPKSVEWLPEYNELDPRKVMLQDFEVQCLREKLNAVYMLGPTTSACDCGIVNEDVMLDFNDDFLVDTEMEAAENNDRVQLDFESNYLLNLQDEQAGRCETTPLSKLNVQSSVHDLEAHSESKVNVDDSAFDRDFDDGFILDENDPIFDDDWTGVDEEEFINPAPISCSTPLVDGLKPHNRKVEAERKTESKPVDTSAGAQEYDSDASTISDEQFGPVICRSSQVLNRSSTINSAKENESPHLHSSPVKLNSNVDVNSEVPVDSSSDECFPPSPEILKRVVKKKFVFHKKSLATSFCPQQNDDPVPFVKHQPAQPAPVSSIVPTFNEWVKPTTVDTFPVVKHQISPPVNPRFSSISKEPPSSSHVHVRQGALPFKNILKDMNENSDISLNPPLSPEYFAIRPVRFKPTTPRVDSVQPQNTIGRNESQTWNERSKTRVGPLDNDSASTTSSDEAFGPVIHRKPSSNSSSKFNFVKTDEILHSQRLLASSTISHNTKVDRASSSDDCLPPSPEPELSSRVVKKKFIFRKKSNTTASLPLQEVNPTPALPDIPQPTPSHSHFMAPLPAPPTFNEWIKPSAMRVRPSLKNASQPGPSQRRTSGKKPYTSKPHVPVSQGALPFKRIRADANESSRAPRSPSTSPEYLTLLNSVRSQSSSAMTSPVSQPSNRKRRKKPRKKNQFVIDEAEVSGDDSSENDGSDEDLDESDMSFVDNEVREPFTET